MSTPVISIRGLEKAYGAGAPLRIRAFDLLPGERVVLAGLDPAAAEMLVHLITGAALPDAGEIAIFGQSTREIATDTEWLTSLDRFGLVSNRAVLLDQSSIAQNMALPMTLAIDPMPPDTRAVVERLAAEAGVDAGRLDQPAGSLAPLERMRVHLARALATNPSALLLEHPTALLDEPAGRALGGGLRAILEARQIALLALSDDAAFGRATGADRRRLDLATGAVRGGTLLSRWFT